MAEILGYRDPRNTGRARLLREIKEREAETGERIMTRTKSDRQLNLRVNLQSMRRWFPEKFRRAPQDFAKEARAYGSAVERRLMEAVETAEETLSSEMGDVKGGLMELAKLQALQNKKIQVLERKVDRLFDAARLGRENVSLEFGDTKD